MVLILVVVDDGLVQLAFICALADCLVLILVVVDDGLVLDCTNLRGFCQECLNPCCSGRWSRTIIAFAIVFDACSLNPCCSGRWSRTYYPCQYDDGATCVLILVVVDDGLVPTDYNYLNFYDYVSLNPCCSGRWSRTLLHQTFYRSFSKVLILVVVDDGLVLMSQISVGRNGDVS